jgi:hypothetical protein
MYGTDAHVNNNSRIAWKTKSVISTIAVSCAHAIFLLKLIFWPRLNALPITNECFFQKW